VVAGQLVDPAPALLSDIDVAGRLVDRDPSWALEGAVLPARCPSLAYVVARGLAEFDRRRARVVRAARHDVEPPSLDEDASGIEVIDPLIAEVGDVDVAGGVVDGDAAWA
jgi:hypothetical protein